MATGNAFDQNGYDDVNVRSLVPPTYGNDDEPLSKIERQGAGGNPPSQNSTAEPASRRASQGKVS